MSTTKSISIFLINNSQNMIHKSNKQHRKYLIRSLTNFQIFRLGHATFYKKIHAKQNRIVT